MRNLKDLREKKEIRQKSGLLDPPLKKRDCASILFKNADLHFIDITLAHAQYFSDRSHYHIADQANPEQLLEVVHKAGGNFDMIIDDGGHTMTQQIVSFTTLFPYLNSGGMYIVEDLLTSYWKDWGGNGSKEAPLAGPDTAIQFFKDLVDEVNFVGARTGESRRNRDLSSIRSELNIYREQIFGIHFYDSLCIIIKR